jgi:iron complex transport system ATP-binding protein
MEMTELLSIRGLSFSFGRRQIFRDVSLSAVPGGVLCLMGPNGCGKTTLLDCVMALQTPSSGEVRLMGKPVSAYRRHELAQKMSFVPQIHEITFPYTVREVVLMGRTAHAASLGRPTEEDERLCLKAIERVGLMAYLDTPYNTLSGGEVKLVLLARALGQGAPLILMDEPTAHLDFRNEMRFLETTADLCRNEGLSVVLATHSPDHAFYFSARAVPITAALFGGGTIRCLGRPEDVVNEETIRAVYGVKAKILTDTAENGTVVRSVSLIESDPEENR